MGVVQHQEQNSNGMQAALTAPLPIPGSRRGQPGRPRKGVLGIFGKPECGHTSGTVTMKPRANSGSHDGTAVQTTIVPRLLDLQGAATYLGLSAWTVRDLEQSGILARVRIPLPNAGELRKLLFDRSDLDQLIERWKERGS